MAHRRKYDDHANHEAWAIPYGDLVTLLMAFFVVMYAVSVVDAGKYRVLSDSLIQAFGAPVRVEPIQIGDPALSQDLVGEDVRRSLSPIATELLPRAETAIHPSIIDPLSPTDLAIQSVLDTVPESERQKILQEISEMAGEIEAGLGQLIEDDVIKVDRQAYWLEIEINTSLLFLSGSATLERSSLPVLEEVAKVLGKREVRIHVEGHTDDRPIGTSIYPSNWELSSGRAATVVNLFAQNGVDPERMVAIGYGQFQPIASNDTEQGRARNRRVAIVVLPGLPPRSSERVEPERLKRDYPRPVDEAGRD